MIRMIAMLLIITCHFMQAMDIELAWWFNVGVQIFLCISGWLYGSRRIAEVTSFYHRRFIKILVPYYIVYVTFGLATFLFAKTSFDVLSFIRGLFLNATIQGAGHLWFVPTILMCYVLIPGLQSYRERYVTSDRKWWIFTIVSTGIMTVFFGAFDRFFNPAWISCFTLGYAIGSAEGKGYKACKTFAKMLGIYAVIGNTIQVYCSYIGNVHFIGYSFFCSYNHVALGIAVFLLMKKWFSNLNMEGLDRLLCISDKFSYEVYLVHALIILGPFSLVNLTKWPLINICVILALICMMTWILKQSERLMYRVLLHSD